MMFFALSIALVFTLTPPVPVNDAVTLTFRIVNDEQDKTFTLDQGDFFFNPPTDFLSRDNVRLKGWYQDESLTRFHDFDLPIMEDTFIYATWDYLNPAISLAVIIPSIPDERVESRTMTLSFALYEPLKEGVRYQWQAAPQQSDQFDNIGGANLDHFQPFRNGTFRYRLRYRIPIYSQSGAVIDTISYYSQPITLTVYGQQSIVGYVVALGLMVLTGMILFLRLKRHVYYDVRGGESIAPGRFYMGEDISLQPKAKKKGHRFIGWYLDSDLQTTFDGMRMPIRSMRLYAKFKKTKAKR